MSSLGDIRTATSVLIQADHASTITYVESGSTSQLGAELNPEILSAEPNLQTRSPESANQGLDPAP